jgi:hypothetical protein
MEEKRIEIVVAEKVPASEAVAYDTPKQLSADIDSLEKRRLQIYQKAVSSDDPDTIMKANAYFGQSVDRGNQPTGLQIKSLLVDPFDFMASFGFKEKPMRMTYAMLKRMATTPFTAATIRTRIAQVQKFAQVQEDEFSVGFKIRPRKLEGKKASKQQLKRSDELMQFLIDGGEGGHRWGRDNFETFITKMVRDSLTYDQYTFEIAENRKGVPVEFMATDASTYRVAFPNDRRSEYEKDPLTGEKCLPKVCQIYNNEIVEEFYPWELCFGVRNPRTDLLMAGYGYAELEELVTVVTSLLWAQEYNQRFFSQGSAPKGIIKISGNIDPTKLQEFKREWQMQMAGVYNSWKTPIMQADKMDWVDLTKSNKDMEYSSWQDFLMKVHSALFLIDASEMGFDINRSQGQAAMFESSNEQRIKYSKDKGLVPILRNFQNNINRHIISRVDPDYELVFLGSDAITPETALERAIKEVTNFKTVDEIRERFSLKPVGDEMGGNLILNGTWMSWYNNQQLMKQQQQGAGDEFGEEGDGDFGQEGQDYDSLNEQDSEEDFGDETEKANKDNPFLKDLDNFVKGIAV